MSSNRHRALIRRGSGAAVVIALLFATGLALTGTVTAAASFLTTSPTRTVQP